MPCAAGLFRFWITTFGPSVPDTAVLPRRYPRTDASLIYLVLPTTLRAYHATFARNAFGLRLAFPTTPRIILYAVVLLVLTLLTFCRFPVSRYWRILILPYHRYREHAGAARFEPDYTVALPAQRAAAPYLWTRSRYMVLAAACRCTGSVTDSTRGRPQFLRLDSRLLALYRWRTPVVLDLSTTCTVSRPFTHVGAAVTATTRFQQDFPAVHHYGCLTLPDRFTPHACLHLTRWLLVCNLYRTRVRALQLRGYSRDTNHRLN